MCPPEHEHTTPGEAASCLYSKKYANLYEGVGALGHMIERRTDNVTRKRVAEMSPEEMRRALLVSCLGSA